MYFLKEFPFLTLSLQIYCIIKNVCHGMLLLIFQNSLFILFSLNWLNHNYSDMYYSELTKYFLHMIFFLWKQWPSQKYHIFSEWYCFTKNIHKNNPDCASKYYMGVFAIRYILVNTEVTQRQISLDGFCCHLEFKEKVQRFHLEAWFDTDNNFPITR